MDKFLKVSQIKEREVKYFEHEQFGKVRALLIDNKPYFVGKDIASALGYLNPRDAIRTKCKGVVKHDNFKEGGYAISLIPESDIYRLIFGSKLESAEKFQNWVFDEVLPSIRRHGMYATDELLNNPDLLIGVATKLKEEREKNKVLKEDNAQKTQIIGELKPKADYTDLILRSKSIVAVTQIAKDYGMSAQEMNNKLHKLKVQYLVGEQWILYAKYQAKGYTHSETIPIKYKDGKPDVKMITKWTQKGRLFIYNLLKENGILPMIEREE